MIKPILRYPGAKWRIAPWIVSHFPSHYHYVEPYCGSAAVFFAKEPAPHEVLNDRNDAIVNLFQVMREQGERLAWLLEMTPYAETEYTQYKNAYNDAGDPVERARRFVLCCWQSFASQVGGSTGWRCAKLAKHYQSRTGEWNAVPEKLLLALDRLKQAEIWNRPALKVIQDFNASDCLVYADPPYLLETRAGRLYEHEMTSEEHVELLHTLNLHRGPAIISGYSHPLYDKHLKKWRPVTISTQAEHGNLRREMLWLNQKANAESQPTLFTMGQDD